MGVGMFRVISFDLDGTVMRSEFGDIVWLEGLPKKFAQFKKIPVEEAKTSFRIAYDQTGKGKREWYDLNYWISKYQLPIAPQQLLDEYSSVVRPFDDVEPVLKKLSRSFILIISSSAMREFIDIELKTSSLRPYFRHIFSSTSDTRMVKKDPFFYKMICQRLHISPKEMIHVGDDMASDVDAPRSIGITSFFLDRSGRTHDDWTVHSLDEFVHRIDELI
jgi:putative hydrolase of the HAD superfamily